MELNNLLTLTILKRTMWGKKGLFLEKQNHILDNEINFISWIMIKQSSRKRRKIRAAIILLVVMSDGALFLLNHYTLCLCWLWWRCWVSMATDFWWPTLKSMLIETTHYKKENLILVIIYSNSESIYSFFLNWIVS